MPITDQQKAGLTDLFIIEEQNRCVLIQLAKSLTKNICEITNEEDALKYCLNFTDDIHLLLNKRLVTRNILFQYLNARNVQTSLDLTKATLIQSLLQYWNNNEISNLSHNSTNVNDSNSIKNEEIQPASKDIVQDNTNLLAHTFSEWFFQRYNGMSLIIEDFYADAHLVQQIVAGDTVNETECFGANNVLQSLINAKKQYELFFNPNLTSEGCQARSDIHGLVLVLICGTLHQEQNCTGVFECTFGLLRDPFAENNYKIKTIKCCLRSQITSQMPSLTME